MPGEVNPALGRVEGAMPAAGLDAGRDGEAGDGVTDHLALTAAYTADGVAHEENLSEVVTAQRGAAEVLAGAELALNGDAVVGVNSEVRSAFVRGVRVIFPAAGTLVFVLEFHLNVWRFPGVVEGRRASPLCGEDCSGCVVCESNGRLRGWRPASRAGREDREVLSGVCGAGVCLLWAGRCR
jgi:hypothetical protein